MYQSSSFPPLNFSSSSEEDNANVKQNEVVETNVDEIKVNGDVKKRTRRKRKPVNIVVQRHDTPIYPVADEETDKIDDVPTVNRVRKRRRRNGHGNDKEKDVVCANEQEETKDDFVISLESKITDIEPDKVEKEDSEYGVKKGFGKEPDVNPCNSSDSKEKDYTSSNSNQLKEIEKRRDRSRSVTVVKSNGAPVKFRSLDELSDSSSDGELFAGKMEKLYLMEEFSTYSVVRETNGFTIEFRLLHDNNIVYSAKHRKRTEAVFITRKAKCHLRDTEFDAIIKVGECLCDFSLRNNCSLSEELMRVRFLRNKPDLGKQVRRRLHITIPCSGEAKSYTLLSKDPELTSKNGYTFSFDKFHVKDSVKNAQLVLQDDVESVVLNIRKVGRDMIEVDTRVLVPPLLIFAIAIGSFMSH